METPEGGTWASSCRRQFCSNRTAWYLGHIRRQGVFLPFDSDFCDFRHQRTSIPRRGPLGRHLSCKCNIDLRLNQTNLVLVQSRFLIKGERKIAEKNPPAGLDRREVGVINLKCVEWALGSLSNYGVDESENVIWNVTSRFCNHFSIIQTHSAWKMCSNYPGIKLEPALRTWEDKIEHLSSYAHVVHTPAKQVISRRRKNDNVYKMSKTEKCQKLKNAKRAKILFFIVKYAKLWGLCFRRGRGCLSSLIKLFGCWLTRA